jgi:hypothetical protein
MKKQLCGILVATQLIGAWFAGAQTDIRPSTKGQSSVIHANIAPVLALSTTNPVIAVYPRSLDFAAVPVGKTEMRSFRVQNVGVGTLKGAAKGSAPFSVVGGSPFVLGTSQSQVITVQYAPTAAGLDITVIRLTGGSGASITVAGSGVPAPRATPTPRARPVPPQNLRLVAGR